MHLPNKNIRHENLLRHVLRDGGPGCCQFAVTNHCNAACDFCNFSTTRAQPKQLVHVPVEGGCAALEILAANGIGYVIFTGGEPTTHPDLARMLSRAAELDLSTTLCTNGWLLTDDRIKDYADAGLTSVLISVDAQNAQAHEVNRQLPGLCARIAEANTRLRELGIQTAASVTISRLIGDFAELPRFLSSLGFDQVTFSYPQRWLSSSYRVFSDSWLVDYQGDELCKAFDEIKRLKRSLRVLNPGVSLEEMKRFTRGDQQRFPCLGGYKYFYLDWHLNVYRCFASPEPMCSVRDFGADKLVRDGCVGCTSDCFRDASVMHYSGMALHDSVRSLLLGHIRTAARQLVNRASYESVSALVEQRKWVQRLHRRRLRKVT